MTGPVESELNEHRADTRETFRLTGHFCVHVPRDHGTREGGIAASARSGGASRAYDGEHDDGGGNEQRRNVKSREGGEGKRGRLRGER